LKRERSPFEKGLLSLFLFAFAKRNSPTPPKTFAKRKKGSRVVGKMALNFPPAMRLLPYPFV
jgi:hypothetical protein